MSVTEHPPLIAIACGGTGGHLFPGIAIADLLLQEGCDVQLLVSPKEIDQTAVRHVRDMEILVLPAVGLQRRQFGRFLSQGWLSYKECRRNFKRRAPAAVLGMGGFTSAPPILAGWRQRARTYLHESNSIPGRANRWLAPWVHRAVVGFPEAASRVRSSSVTVSGTPVRGSFHPGDVGAARVALGLSPGEETLLVMGGSQGAHGVNELVLKTIPELLKLLPRLQFIHLTGKEDSASTQAEYARLGAKAVVRPFLTEMELALGAATIAISRSGASCLAELAAMRLPSVLVPYPAAADNHQYFNAKAFEQSGAARLFPQEGAVSELLRVVVELISRATVRAQMKVALAHWHRPNAAQDVAHAILSELRAGHGEKVEEPRKTEQGIERYTPELKPAAATENRTILK